MIVADLYSNLGNQLFAYTATKSIALDLGYEYRYRVVRPSFVKQDSGVDDYGQEYESHFEKFFSIDTSERIKDIPETINNKWKWERTPNTNFIQDVYTVPKNTHLTGYFLCPKYFEHRRNEVLKWFRFQNEILNKCEHWRDAVIKKTKANHLVAVHVRCGEFYKKLNMVLDPAYQINAIRTVKDKFPNDNLCFILFSDVPKEAQKMLKNANKDIFLHDGSMFEDLCMMTLCDSHIIANSSFSWWGAWLSKRSKGITIRPSKWPTAYKGSAPEDIFPKNWLKIRARRKRIACKNLIGVLADKYKQNIYNQLKRGKRFAKLFFNK